MKKYISSIIIFIIAYIVLAGIFEMGETASVILSLVVAGLFYNSRKNKQTLTIKNISTATTEEMSGESEKENEDEELEKDYEFGGIWGAKPRKGTEAYKIQEEVKKRKMVAENKKVKELISELYFSTIEHFPSWIKTDHNREYVPSIISKATERKEKGAKGAKGDNDKKITEIILNGRDYKFAFQENSFSTPDGEYHTHGLLELFIGNEKVLAMDMSLEHSDYDSKWNPFGIEAFIDGDWIDDFSALKKAKQQDEKERALKEAENPEKTEKLKKDFGI